SPPTGHVRLQARAPGKETAVRHWLKSELASAPPFKTQKGYHCAILPSMYLKRRLSGFKIMVCLRIRTWGEENCTHVATSNRGIRRCDNTLSFVDRRSRCRCGHGRAKGPADHL